MNINTPQLSVDILRDRASMYHVSATRIEGVLRSAFAQNYVYLIKRADDQYQVIMELADVSRG